MTDQLRDQNHKEIQEVPNAKYRCLESEVCHLKPLSHNSLIIAAILFLGLCISTRTLLAVFECGGSQSSFSFVYQIFISLNTFVLIMVLTHNMLFVWRRFKFDAWSFLVVFKCVFYYVLEISLEDADILQTAELQCNFLHFNICNNFYFK